MFLSEDEIKFEPSITDFETVFLSMYDLIVAKCSNLPRIEAKLFSDRPAVCFFKYNKKKLFSMKFSISRMLVIVNH
jgi:hypothetical protein